MKDELLNCQFCDGKPKVSEKNDQHIANVKHSRNCFFSERGMDDRIFYFNIDSWNTRVPPPATLVPLDEDKLINFIALANCVNPEIKLNKKITWIYNAPKLAKAISQRFGQPRRVSVDEINNVIETSSKGSYLIIPSKVARLIHNLIYDDKK